MRAGPLLRSGIVVAVEGPRDAHAVGPSCLISAVPGLANDASGVCLPFCSNAIWKSPTHLAPGALSVTSTVVVWPTYFAGFAISMAGPGSRPA